MAHQAAWTQVTHAGSLADRSASANTIARLPQFTANGDENHYDRSDDGGQGRAGQSGNDDMSDAKVRRRLAPWIFVICGFIADVAVAQEFPSQPVRIIVPFGPGSGSDIVARRVGAVLQALWKKPVVIDNRPGAQGVIATEMLRNAPPDGHTLGVSTNSTHAAAVLLFKKLPYDSLRDFEHIALVGTGGSVALVPKDSPFKSVAELVAYARARPGSVLYGYADTISQVPPALLRARAGLRIEGVPYKSVTGLLSDLIGGQIHLAFFNSMTAAAQVAGGRLLPIAITEAQRNQAWPGVPAVAESFAGYEVSYFIGFSAPHGVPAPILAKIQHGIAHALAQATVRTPLENMGLRFSGLATGEYAGFIRAQTERWRDYVRAAGLQPQ